MMKKGNKSKPPSSLRTEMRSQPLLTETSVTTTQGLDQHTSASSGISGQKKDQRLPVSRKSKKNTKKRLKTSKPMEQAPADTASSVDALLDSAQLRPLQDSFGVNVQVPSLPKLVLVVKRGKDIKKVVKPSNAKSPSPLEKTLVPAESDPDSNVRSGYDFDDFSDTAVSENHAKQVHQVNWMSTRLALSQQSSRFELPMDMKQLESITPQDYLRKYCVVTSRRICLYQKMFIKNKDKANSLNKTTLETCLRETLVHSLKENTYPDLCDLLDITDNTVVDFKLFAGVAAIAERILYPLYTTDDTIDRGEYQRERIEIADFEALDWKLHGIKVGAKMRKLLKMIE